MRKKKINLRLPSFFTLLFCMGLLFSNITIAQTASYVTVGASNFVCATGTDACPANDLQVADIFVQGADECISCEPGSSVTRILYMRIYNSTGSVRTSFALFGNLSNNASIEGHTGKIFICVGPINITKGLNEFPVGEITFICGTQVTLTDNYLAYTPANGSTETVCANFAKATKCKDISPKCGVAATINIRTPGSASVTSETKPCTGTSTGSFTITPINGTAPYNIKVYTNPTATCPTSPSATDLVSTCSNVAVGGTCVVNNRAAGNYCIYMTDANNCVFKFAYNLASVFCCTPPTVGANPGNATKCAGQSASFISSASAGNPTPTVQWQVKPLGGNIFTDISPVGPSAYSGFATSTLGISDVTGLNGYEFRAIFTSTDCTPATSNPATLTVTPLPTANAGSAPVSACFVSGATGNTFNLSGSGSNGTQSWSVQSKNPNTLTAVITNGNTYNPSVKVTGTTEGTVTLRLSVSTASCGTATSDVTVTTLAVPSEPDVTYIPPPTCTDATFKITVDNPHDGSTYTLRQLSGGIGPITKTAPANVVGGKITFEGLIPGKGYRVTETNGGGCISTPEACGDFSSVVGARMSPQSITNEETQTTTVKAYPNPFSDRVKFMVTSTVAGKGNLEVYNMMGQKVKTVYQGYIAKGTQTFELSLPGKQVANLVYVLRIGDKKMTGKILQVNQ